MALQAITLFAQKTDFPGQPSLSENWHALEFGWTNDRGGCRSQWRFTKPLKNRCDMLSRVAIANYKSRQRKPKAVMLAVIEIDKSHALGVIAVRGRLKGARVACAGLVNRSPRKCQVRVAAPQQSNATMNVRFGPFPTLTGARSQSRFWALALGRLLPSIRHKSIFSVIAGCITVFGFEPS